MKKEIIINSSTNEVRIAITEEGKLAEFFIELPEKERSIGNVYLGKVSKIIQGINAAFIDIGANQDAFLHFSDVDESLENMATDEDEDEEDADDDDDDLDIFDDLNFTEPVKSTQQEIEESALRKTKSAPPKSNQDSGTTFRTKKMGNVQINLEEKQFILVQIVREAYGQKGVRVTTKIAIPGRYTVLLPFDGLIGISKKIASVKERKRLRYLAKTTLPKGFGCIIRTAAHGITEADLLKDWENLLAKWQEIEQKVKKSDSPCMVYQDMELAASVIRDLFTKDVERVVCDSKKLYKEIVNYLKWASPALVEKVEHYDGKLSIFDAFGIEKELESTYKRKIQLPTGGSIVIDQTEAMLVIDVNSGKSISEKHQEQNALNTNFEALKEIARQIRIRDNAGIILIDFIDINNDSLRKKIYLAMKKELSRDRAKTVVYPLTQLSIMQITRQRINQNITEKISENCPMCNGRGRIQSKSVLINSIERWLRNFRSHCKEFRLILHVHPHVASYLTEGTISRLSKLMLKYFVKIKVQQSEHVSIDGFKFESVRRNKDITQEYMVN